MLPSVPVVPVSTVFTISVVADPIYLLDSGDDVAQYHPIMCVVLSSPVTKICPVLAAEGTMVDTVSSSRVTM